MADGKITEIYNSTKSGVTTGFARGPLASLEGDPFAGTQAVFPLDVTGLGQRHFVRFNIIDVRGFRLNTGSPEKSSEQADESVSGEILGGLTGALAGGGLLGGAAGAIATNLLNQSIGDSTIGGAIDDFFTPEAGGDSIFSSVRTNLIELQNSIVEEIPIAEDSLNGIGSFLGSIGKEAEQFSDTILGKTESVGDIILYMPPGASETYQVSWEGSNLGTMGGAVKDFAEGGTEKVKQLMSETKAMDAVKSALVEGVAGAAGAALGTEAIGDLINKQAGQALNPNFELFFKGVQPRTFSFDFKLAPKNAEEAREIVKIVRMFKYYSAPGTLPGAEGLRYWTYPQLFEIEYWNSAVTHKIKPCGLTQVSVNYSGDGTNHTHYDGYPLQTDLTLTFTESELLTKDSFSEDPSMGGY